jgi:hypothetical protein
VSDKPGKVFNLDALDREGAPEPFQFSVKGQRFVVDDIESRDWQDLVAMGDDPEEGLRVALGPDQWEKFRAVKGVPMWKVGKLVEAISEHFGLGEPGEGDASSGS